MVFLSNNGVGLSGLLKSYELIHQNLEIRSLDGGEVSSGHEPISGGSESR